MVVVLQTQDHAPLYLRHHRQVIDADGVQFGIRFGADNFLAHREGVAGVVLPGDQPAKIKDAFLMADVMFQTGKSERTARGWCKYCEHDL